MFQAKFLPVRDFLNNLQLLIFFIHTYTMKSIFIRKWKGVAVMACTISLHTFSLSAQNRLVLHYDRPAEYFEEALVIGNGTMGAILYGGTDKDVLSLNDLTLWTGEPDRKVTTPDAHKAIPEIRALLDKEDYRGADLAQRKVQGHYSENYQPLGQLSLTYLDEPAQVTGYQRSLDIRQALARTSYQRNGKAFSCDYFASAPDSVIVLRLQTESEKAFRHFFLSPHSCPMPPRLPAMKSRPKATQPTIRIRYISMT